MQVLVLYHSRTGNTKALAEAVAEGVQRVEGTAALVRTPNDVTRDDFVRSGAIVAGSPVYFGGMAAELKSVFDQFLDVRPKMEGKLGAAFACSAHPAGGKETTMMSILTAMLIYGMIVMGDPVEAGGHYGVACAGKPNEKTLGDARDLGERVAQTALRMSG
jgi:NAD(P)H dehydrogenase (quinone)